MAYFHLEIALARLINLLRVNILKDQTVLHCAKLEYKPTKKVLL